MALTHLAALAAFVQLSTALPWQATAPAPTQASSWSDDGWSPAPTNAPQHHLEGRGQNLGTLGWWPYESTFISRTCDPAENHVVYNTFYKNVKCCPGTQGCGIVTGCVNSRESPNSRVMHCYNDYTCVQHVYPQSFTEWACISAPYYTVLNLETTYPGMAAAESLAIFSVDASENPIEAGKTQGGFSVQSVSDSPRPSPVGASSTRAAVASSAGAPSTGSSAPADQPGGSSEGASSSGSSSSSSSSGSSVPLGPVIGGAVGGAALIAIAVLLIFCARKRGWCSKKSRKNTLPPKVAAASLGPAMHGRSTHYQPVSTSEHRFVEAKVASPPPRRPGAAPRPAAKPTPAASAKPTSPPRYDKKGLLIVEKPATQR
ncbi:hypothetical protein VHEMI01294 [[Torrubiella] hemipterigena]|uniref:Uncharacterized protein n=1 Tax=[Torrubiella] hemipterigena TaxID=1531966 RepID=A0A0A1T763_9HYPO|nr:hypothetical protein VHEMI01294 [[Torrubiella] hemipterigena]